ncbi:jg1654 [Pararge aegeria aegeria]|uniref:Jg1654 protein n=1 Tax=Pararge aegeria aegeria TaxID=348720 RepID=A0A8S4RCJ1_9NEOP|nr:jg1654 [Pararge aegeria aegeria]
MGRLQRVVWEGQGARLLSEVSSQPVVKRFLEAVPYIMNTIRDIHSAVIQNDLEGIMKLTSDPVPPQALSSRDANNLTAMHKAAGLGHCGIMKYIIERYPQGINDVDNDGRTPLHYAAVFKDDQHTYNTLISSGADESIVDNKNKTPAYYINRTQDIDKNILKILPEAPRTPSGTYPSSWDWKILDTEFVGEINTKKNRKKNVKASNENISSKNNTSTVTDSIDTNNVSSLKNSSTHELISDLPDLNDSEKQNVGYNDPSEDHTEDIKETTEIEKPLEGKNEEDTIEETEKESADKIEMENVSENSNRDVEIQVKEENADSAAERKNSDKNNEQNEMVEHNIGTDLNENTEEIVEQSKNSDEDKDEMGGQNEITAQSNEDEENPQENANDNRNNVMNNDEKETQHESTHNSPRKLPEESQLKEDDSNMKQLESEHNNNDNKNTKNINGYDEKLKDQHSNNQNEIIENENSKQEEDETCEGNSNHNNEDDDDVQVQGTCYPEHSDTYTKSATFRQNNGSTKRGNFTNGRNIQESLIEGIISSEAEQETQDASVTQRDNSVRSKNVVDNEIDPEVTDLIYTANMEMLATLVLNGEGSRLIGRRSGNVELQAFLDNVPNYMEKINRVHIAARDGNIKDLQSALDRRKFAIARDPISANGATPLHVATIHGKTNIIKYLGGRFPETLSAVDFEGRTALHFAAVIPDNGHYYILLQQLGANSKDLDDIGRSAEDYYRNPTLLPFKQLLSDFGISEEKAQTMFSDQVPDDRVSSRRILDIPEALDTLERCYRLLASARSTRTPLSASSNKSTPPHVLGRFLKRQTFDLLKYRITKLDHNLFDVIWPAVKKLPANKNIVQIVEEDFPGGVTAPDYYVYEVFTEFLTPLIKDLHNINIYSDLPQHPISDFVKNSPLLESSEKIVEINIDSSDEFVLSGTMECSRNLDGFEMPLNLKIGKLEAIERIITTVLMRDDFTKIIAQLSPESDQNGGSYYTLNEILEKPSEICAALAASGLLISLCDRDEIDDCNRLHGKQWPYGRGVFVSYDNTVAVWINVHDHLRVVASTPADVPGEIGLTFSKLSYIMTYLHKKLDFVFDDKLGHLSSRPSFLGASIRFSLIVNFPGLAKDSDNIKHLCAVRGLQYRETLSSDIARISNYQCLSITESNCFNDFATATLNLLHLEKDVSMQNSAHITTMLSNIFRRKRSSLADIHDVEKMQD